MSKACSFADALPRSRARVTVRGTVQGVGFRPFVYRLATEMHLAGWVRNSADGVRIEVEGPRLELDRFVTRLENERPVHAVIRECAVEFDRRAGLHGFHIRDSDRRGPVSTRILPDFATCPECRRELFDPANRRHRYPFTNCTLCGPRFSIIECLPYDRPHTTMKRFTMCPDCEAEYRDPADRRFHAQPNACPRCGPQLALRDPIGRTLACREDALSETVRRLRRGAIVALKGVGGFQLLVDARNQAAVQRLRQRKQRPAKPFAVMFPDLAAIRQECSVSSREAAMLTDATAPIVLLRRRRPTGSTRPGRALAAAIAPGNPRIGAMLPYSPLHLLLLADLGFPVVATSGNLSDEPICIDEEEAIERLGGIADVFLVHNRPIARPLDDSVVRELLGEEQVLRRARGHAPFPVQVAEALPPILGFGAHLKNTVAVSVGRDIHLSQHVGDLSTPQAREVFRRTAADLPRLFGVEPELAVCDLHPGYDSTRLARSGPRQVISVQHHFAHVLACIAEHDLREPVLGVCWDGTGYGADGTIWGGEFLRVTPQGFERFGRFRPFPLPGGGEAAREPRRSALGLLHRLGDETTLHDARLPAVCAFTTSERRTLLQMLDRRIDAVDTSSVGRLFDAVASLTGLCQENGYDGQAATAVEFAVTAGEDRPYPVALTGEDPVEFDWRPMLRALLADVRAEAPVGRIAARFHETLVHALVAAAHRAGLRDIVLTGGCFQNHWLAETAARRLQAAGFRPHWPQRIPPNDGGIALGQVIAAARALHPRRRFAVARRDG